MNEKETFNHIQKLYKCSSCAFVDPKAIGKGVPCCQYGGKLNTGENVCLSHRSNEKEVQQ